MRAFTTPLLAVDLEFARLSEETAGTADFTDFLAGLSFLAGPFELVVLAEAFSTFLVAAGGFSDLGLTSFLGDIDFFAEAAGAGLLTF